MKITNAPLLLVTGIVWSTSKLSGVSTDTASFTGIGLILFSFATLVLEFFKSGDIGLRTFASDQAFSVAQTVLASVTLALVIRDRGFAAISLPDVVFAVVTLCDAWLSPFNSFRTALRNISGTNITTHPSAE